MARVAWAGLSCCPPRGVRVVQNPSRGGSVPRTTTQQVKWGAAAGPCQPTAPAATGARRSGTQPAPQGFDLNPNFRTLGYVYLGGGSTEVERRHLFRLSGLVPPAVPSGCGPRPVSSKSHGSAALPVPYGLSHSLLKSPAPTHPPPSPHPPSCTLPCTEPRLHSLAWWPEPSVHPYLVTGAGLPCLQPLGEVSPASSIDRLTHTAADAPNRDHHVQRTRSRVALQCGTTTKYGSKALTQRPHETPGTNTGTRSAVISSSSHCRIFQVKHT